MSSEALRLLRQTLKRFLVAILGRIPLRAEESVTVHDDDGNNRGSLTLGPSGADDTLPPPTTWGRHLSDRGERLVALLREKGTMTKTAAATALGWQKKGQEKVNPTDLGCIQDMIDRGVIDYEDGEGIRLPDTTP